MKYEILKVLFVKVYVLKTRPTVRKSVNVTELCSGTEFGCGAGLIRPTARNSVNDTEFG